jgi:phosphoribosylformylglycinamidine synthase
VSIGAVTADGKMRVRDRGQVVAEIPARELADEAPLYDRPHTLPFRAAPIDGPPIPEGDPEADLVALVGSGDLCSKRWIWEQYDHMVRTNTTQGPGGDAAIVRIKETGTSIAMALDGSGRYAYLAPREGARLAVAECCRNLSTAGALPVAATNCLNFGNPEKPEIMAQLVEAIEGMAEACRFFETPITGGNVSLYNETLGEGIYPTPVMGIVGLLGIAPPLAIPFVNAGRSIVLLGGLGACDEVRFGSTEYAKEIVGQLWGLPPALDLDKEKRVQEAMRQVAAEGLAESAHDLSDGGLAVALAECCFGKEQVGAQVDLASDLRPEILLFHEGPSRILVSTANPKAVAAIAAQHGIEAVVIGTTIESGLEIRQRGNTLGAWDIATIRAAFENALMG